MTKVGWTTFAQSDAVKTINQRKKAIMVYRNKTYFAFDGESYKSKGNTGSYNYKDEVYKNLGI